MADSITSDKLLALLDLENNEQTAAEFQLSGAQPISIASTEIKRTLTVVGITPEDFMNAYSSVEFDFEGLKDTFKRYCKDFEDPLIANQPSKALEFSAKMLFEFGPYIRTERKTKGDKAVRFRFPYRRGGKDSKSPGELVLKVVLVTTFKEMDFQKQVEGGKLILTFRQAGLLAMVTFMRAIDLCYNSVSTKLMTPLCGAIFSRDSLQDMARELGIEEVQCLKIINASSASGGQYLNESNIACAIVCMVTSTKRVTDKNIRDSMISKTVKQYIHQRKEYRENEFAIFAKYALGGVPPGLDSGTLIEKYSNIQLQSISLRARVTAVKQSETYYEAVGPSRSTSTATSGPSPRTPSVKKHLESDKFTIEEE